jgi:AraC-like DNA-binding protein
MHIRSFFLLAAIVAALTVHPALAAPGGPVASASGGIHWTIPLPNAFGVEVVNQPLAALALEAGFADQSHFTRSFRRRTGLPPGKYRRAHR